MNTEASAPQPDEAERDAASAALRQRLDYLFRQCDTEGDSGARMLFNAMLEHRLESLR